jgi:hypothetical protein
MKLRHPISIGRSITPLYDRTAWGLDGGELAAGGEGPIGDNPAGERQLDHKAITVKELCKPYLNDLKAGLIPGKGGRPKKPTIIITDTGHIERHIIPLLGTRLVRDPLGVLAAESPVDEQGRAHPHSRRPQGSFEVAWRLAH